MKTFTWRVGRALSLSNMSLGTLAGVAVVLAVALSIGGQRAAAQSTTAGGLSGNVFDASGAAIPGATVIAHNNGTDAEQSVATDASGFYRMSNLPPAAY